MTVSAGTYNGIAIKPPTDPNFLDFHVSANQRALTPETEIGAVLPDGRDITTALREIGGLSLVLQPGLFDSSSDRKLDAGTRRKLEALGAFESSTPTPSACRGSRMSRSMDADLRPGRHRDRAHLPTCARLSPDRGRWQPPAHRVGRRGSGESLLHRRANRQGDPRRRHAPERCLAAKPFFGYTLAYIVQTARNWRGPIGTFHLTVQGGPVAFDGRPRGEVGSHRCAAIWRWPHRAATVRGDGAELRSEGRSPGLFIAD